MIIWKLCYLIFIIFMRGFQTNFVFFGRGLFKASTRGLFFKISSWSWVSDYITRWDLLFLLLNIPLDETSSSYSIFDEVHLFNIESSKGRSIIEIFLSKEIIRVDFSSQEFVDKVARYASRFELIHSSFNRLINSFNTSIISSFLDFS